jgi:hypothetical protein
LRDRLLADLFADAMAQPSSSRADWLRRNCPDAELRREVESMLAGAVEAAAPAAAQAARRPQR